MQREKITKSGALLEADFYPIFNNGSRVPTRAPKTKPSSDEQKRYNRTIAIKKFIRLVNANFDTTDFLLHPTYTQGFAPQSEEQARKDIVNFFRRVRTKRASFARQLKKDLENAKAASNLMPQNSFLQDSIASLKERISKLEAPFKYAYVIEKKVYKSGKLAGNTNWHFHAFITGGLEARVIESMWKNGLRTNCNNYQPDKFGPEAAALYMSKNPQGAKSFSYSRNLDKPEEKVRDGKVSKNVVTRMATERLDDREYWEKRYKGYRFIRCYNRYNPYNGHWYITAIMFKTDSDSPVKWDEEEWITSDYTAEGG